MENNNYTDKNFWDKYFHRHRHELSIVTESQFSDIFEKYLKPDKDKKILEIGCADSNFLCYLSKRFAYQAHGIDNSDAITRTVDLFRFNNLPEPILYKQDFFSWISDTKFDIVCSFGFIEHFDDINQVIKRHSELIAPQGEMIITLPHFAHAQYFFHWLIDRENLKKHNTKIMNLKSIRKAVEDSGFKIKHLSYYKTFGFWTERDKMNSIEKLINWTILKFGKIIIKIFGYNKPNFLFSPHIVCVATKL